MEKSICFPELLLLFPVLEWFRHQPVNCCADSLTLHWASWWKHWQTERRRSCGALLTSLPSCFNACEPILITNFTKLCITYLCSWSIRTRLLCNVLQSTDFQSPPFLFLYLLFLPAPSYGTLNAQYPSLRASVFMPCCLASHNERGKAEPVPTACSAPLKVCQRGRVMGKSSPCLGTESLSGFMQAHGNGRRILYGLFSYNVISIRIWQDVAL